MGIDIDVLAISSDGARDFNNARRTCSARLPMARAAGIFLIAVVVAVTLTISINTSVVLGGQGFGRRLSSAIQEGERCSEDTPLVSPPTSLPKCCASSYNDEFAKLDQTMYICVEGSLVAHHRGMTIPMYPAYFDVAYYKLHEKYRPTDIKNSFQRQGNCGKFASITQKCANVISNSIESALRDKACKPRDCYWKLAEEMDRNVNRVVKEMEPKFMEDIGSIMARHSCKHTMEQVRLHADYYSRQVFRLQRNASMDADVMYAPDKITYPEVLSAIQGSYVIPILKSTEEIKKLMCSEPYVSDMKFKGPKRKPSKHPQKL